MALDYTMTRDAVNTALANELSRAQGVGESAATIGFLGGGMLEDGGGLMQLLKNPKQFGKNIKQAGYDRQYEEGKEMYDAMYQQGLEDNPYLMESEEEFWNNPENFEQDNMFSNLYNHGKDVFSTWMFPFSSNSGNLLGNNWMGPYGSGGSSNPDGNLVNKNNNDPINDPVYDPAFSTSTWAQPWWKK